MIKELVTDTNFWAISVSVVANESEFTVFVRGPEFEIQL